MFTRLILAPFLISLTATPLLADGNLDPAAPARPGAVALYLSAHTLHTLGQTAKDPLMVLTAARILRGLSVTAANRSPDPAPPDPAPKDLTPLIPLDAKSMLTTASTLDAGHNHTDLIEAVTREVPPAPKALRASASTLAPGASEVWTLAFFGGTYGELAIIGHANGNLDLLVSDDKGITICQDNGSGDTAICGFTPAQNGSFTVTVTNPGPTPDGYILLTN